MSTKVSDGYLNLRARSASPGSIAQRITKELISLRAKDKAWVRLEKWIRENETDSMEVGAIIGEGEVVATVHSCEYAGSSYVGESLAGAIAAALDDQP